MQQIIVFQLQTILFIILSGTLAPLFLLYFSRDVSIGSSFFNVTIIPIVSSIFLLLIYLHTNIINIKSLPNFYIILFIFFFIFTSSLIFLSIRLIDLIFLYMSLLLSIPIIINWWKIQPNSVIRLDYNRSKCASDLRLNYSPMLFAHTGVLLFILGCLQYSNSTNTYAVVLKDNHHIFVPDWLYYFRGIQSYYGPTFHSICADNITSQFFFNKYYQNTSLFPEIRWYYSCQQFDDYNNLGQQTILLPGKSPEAFSFILNSHIEIFNKTTTFARKACPFISTNFLADHYVIIGTGNSDTGWHLTLTYHPFIFCIWFAFILVSFAFLSFLFQFLTKKTKDTN